MGTAVGSMYSYLQTGFDGSYLIVGWLMFVGLIGTMWLGRNL
jgi:hypothetical protein